MIIISEYTESDKGDGVIIECNQDCICPLCQSTVCHRDWKPRIMKLDGGQVRWLVIERRQCINLGCHKLHSLLPDKLVPYKHYASELITGVLDGDIGPEDPMNEEYPCDETLHRWNHWFMANLFRIEGYCGLVWHHVLDPGMGFMQPGASILETIQRSCDRWLAAILRMIYNSGGFLVSS